MAKIQNISEIHPTLGFTEFDIIEKYRKSFHESELGRLHSVFPFERMAKTMGLSEQRLGRRNIFSPSAKIALMVLKAYTGFSDRQLVEHLNVNIHYQMFCGIMINPSFPITNYKIVSAIRNEIASRLDIDSLQEVLASHWKPYLDSLHVCMTDATCYESHMRYPTDVKLLWESLEREVFDERYAVYLYVVDLRTELDGLYFLASHNGTHIMTVNADDTITDLPAFKQILFLYKNLSDDGKTLLVILSIAE